MGLLTMLVVLAALLVVVVLALRGPVGNTHRRWVRVCAIGVVLCPLLMVLLFVLGLSGVLWVERWVYRTLFVLLLTCAAGAVVFPMLARRADVSR